MGLSRRAKRGLAIFNHLQSKTKRWRYHAKQMVTTIDLNKFDAPILQAGLDAIQKMRENADAIKKLSNEENHPVPEDSQERTEPGVHVQPEDVQEGTQGSDDSASGGAK